MAYDKVNRKLYTTVDAEGNKIGIPLWEIMQCLAYFKRDKNGYRNLGTIVKNAPINKWAKYKPFASQEQNFETAEDRDNARKLANQGLIIPTAYNSGVSTTDSPTMQTYLGTLIVKAREGVAPNWEYRRPLGAAFNEPFRALDFDGYKHLDFDGSRQPYETNILGLNKTLGTGTDLIAINRFIQSELTCRFSKLYADLKFSDLLPNLDYLHFCVEVYDANNPVDLDEKDPIAVYVCPQTISEVADNEWQDIVLDLNELGQQYNGRYVFVLGINKFSAGAGNAPDANGSGFIEPWKTGMLPVYNIKIDYYGVLDLRHEYGFYLPSLNGGFASFDLKDYDDLTMKGTESDKVGISLKFRRRAENYYITGSKAYTVPSGAISYKFRLINQGGATVVGTLSDATMTSDATHAVVAKGSNDEWQTVYLRFDNFLPNSGDSVTYGILEVSTDNGNTWTQISASAMAGGYIEPGCDGSSIKLYLTRK